MESTNHLLESKKRQIETVKNALKDLTDALNGDHYSKDFEFVSPPNAADLIKMPILKNLAQRLNDKGIGFDPSLVVQHLEKEVLRQFNEEVESTIKGLHVSKLMAMKHIMEQFDIKDRVDHFQKSLETLEKEILTLTTGVSDEESSKKADNKKTSKKR